MFKKVKKESDNKQKKDQYPKKSYKGIFKKVFWTGFFGVLVMGALSMIRTVNLDSRISALQSEVTKQKAAIDEIPAPKETEEKTIEINENGAKLFAEKFAIDYFTWNYEENKNEERIQRLQPYLASGMIGTAGYDVSKIVYASKVNASDIWEIKVSGDTVDVVVKVDHILTEQVKEKKKTVDQVVAQGEKYLNIPLVTNGTNFKVKELPYFVQAPSIMDYAVQPLQMDTNMLITDEVVCGEIRSFMETFFKFATTGTKEELGYYTKADVDSLQGIYGFVNIENVVVYEEKDGYQVYADVWMNDVTTGAEVLLETSCTLIKEQGRFIVAEIKY